jgi:hypothetical protein
MSFEISELMVQLSEATEKAPGCRDSSTKAPTICEPGSTTKAPKEPPKICEPGSTTKVPKEKPMICQPGSSTKAQLDDHASAMDDLDAVRAQMRERLATV